MSITTGASSLNITFKAEGSQDYLKDVTDLTIGNMVDPATQTFWYGPIDKNPWIWMNDGTNSKKFALMCNYNYNGTAKTAYSEVVIDPDTMLGGSHDVVVTLQTAAILDEKSNSILMFKSATVDGNSSTSVSVQQFPNQSAATFYGTDPQRSKALSANSINVSACDNELYVIACNSTISYQLCHILSGNSNLVDVVANITQGSYTEPATLNGVTSPLQKQYDVSIPSGTYSIMAVGIDWGGGQQIELSVTSDTVSKPFGNGGYVPGPTVKPEVFWTNNGKVLTTITVD